MLLDFHVKTGTRFVLRDKLLFERSEVEITRVDCIVVGHPLHGCPHCFLFCFRVTDFLVLMLALLFGIEITSLVTKKLVVFIFESLLTLVLLNPVFANSVDPDQLASKKPTDMDLHCLSLSILCINALN